MTLLWIIFTGGLIHTWCFSEYLLYVGLSQNELQCVYSWYNMSLCAIELHFNDCCTEEEVLTVYNMDEASVFEQ